MVGHYGVPVCLAVMREEDDDKRGNWEPRGGTASSHIGLMPGHQRACLYSRCSILAGRSRNAGLRLIGGGGRGMRH